MGDVIIIIKIKIRNGEKTISLQNFVKMLKKIKNTKIIIAGYSPNRN
jgi:hypothetical protein